MVGNMVGNMVGSLVGNLVGSRPAIGFGSTRRVDWVGSRV